MNQINMAEIFSTPKDYKEPTDFELKSNSQYPNLNSREYMKKPSDQSINIQKYYEKLIMNEDGHAILSCNDYTTRTWDGSIWGFENIEDVGVEAKSAYKLQCSSVITDICFADKNIILISDSSGAVQLWSNFSENRNVSGFCMFMLGNRYEHTGIVNGIDVFKCDKFKAVSVSTDFSIKIWDMGNGDLSSINTIRNAHFGNITGVSTSPENESVFVTCSKDKNVMLWDYRQIKPASGLFEKHITGLTKIYWSTASESNQLIYVGDEIGQLHTIDARKPGEFINNIEVFSKKYSPIHSIKFKNTYYGVCGNTNEVKVFDSSTSTEIYSSKKSQNYVRDICWSHTANNIFYTIDWDSTLKKHQTSIPV